MLSFTKTKSNVEVLWSIRLWAVRGIFSQLIFFAVKLVNKGLVGLSVSQSCS
jgi:hypothetical protein